MSLSMTVNEKINALRDAFCSLGADGVLLPSCDPHCSESLPDHFNSLPYFTGFTGENSLLAVTKTDSALWCDGRFYVQGDKQLSGTEIVCMHGGAPGVAKLEAYLRTHFSAGQTLLVDGRCVPAYRAHEWERILAEKGARLRSADVVNPLWADARPALPNTHCRLLTKSQTGYTVREKIELVRADLRAAKATALVVPELDCVGWLCNLRADDLPNTPLAIAYAFLTQQACVLFLDPDRLCETDRAQLTDAGVQLRGYEELMVYLQHYDKPQTVLADPRVLSWDLFEALRVNTHFTIKEGADPITARKCVKNEVELANIRECHIRDGVAMVRFEMDLEEALLTGKPLRETDIEAMLKARRSEMPGYFEDSFPTIAAYGPNGAMMHYHAELGSDAEIAKMGFLLVDCGGQYDCGTTDITRTYPVGVLTKQERLFYTWTLQCHIDIARTVFLNTCTGAMLDSIARAPLWRHKINYRCGTGHGVGFISGVHEGPQNLNGRDKTVFKPGMIITDEPGVYETDQVGIRIENELECVYVEENQYGTWLGFRPLTLVPIATGPVLLSELSREQIDWLNDYHKTVYTKLSPYLTDPEKTWLQKKTEPLAK